MASDSERTKPLFNAARELTDPARRGAFLDEACAGDPALRARVERLLGAAKDADDFLAGCAPALEAAAAGLDPSETRLVHDAPQSGDEKLGSKIGPYKLLEKIGEGGCGVVYMAEQQEPVRRRVALKVIKMGMDTKAVIARFEAERQALAMMDHPNIARVLDAGATEAGRPFFVMELVYGSKITEYCDQNELGLEPRLELFIKICQAIQHAHQKGIIHRDIKPSNILVTMHDGVPVPKVIDFGIAKATEEQLTDKTLFTAYAQLIGTPAYMSPEQVEFSGLGLDTRSDIYGLGVLLYELLTGRTPFDTKELLRAGVDEMRRTLRERDPSTPSAMLRTLGAEELTKTAQQRQLEAPRLLSQLRGDLDWIVMKALEKDRTRRYETANGLAMDIQRYLKSEPVLARPPSRWYRFQKLVRRNRILFASGTAVAAALLLGTIVSTRLFFLEREARTIEAGLRHESELREKAMHAAWLVSQHRFEDAEKMLPEILLRKPSSEANETLRALGDWAVLNGRWQQATQRFSILVNQDKVESSGAVMFDYADLCYGLIELGDNTTYERCRTDAIGRFKSATNIDMLTAERLLKVCLLRPAEPGLIAALKPFARIAAESQTGARENGPSRPSDGWTSVALGLFEYRCGNYQASIDWCRRGVNILTNPLMPAAPAHVILAMALHHVHEDDASRAEISSALNAGLDKARVNVEEQYWRDWEFAHILLQEATSLLSNNQRAPHSDAP